MSDLEIIADPDIDSWARSGRVPGPGDPAVSWAENRAWLDERIARGDRFILVTDRHTLPPYPNGYVPGKPNGLFTAAELDYLTKKGNRRAEHVPMSRVSRGEGYQVVEPSGLGQLLAKANTFEFAAAILSWLVNEVRLELGPQLTGVTVEVICVKYFGAYPAIGVRYETDRDDVGPLIEATSDRLLRDRTVSDFLRFVSDPGFDLREIALRLKAST